MQPLPLTVLGQLTCIKALSANMGTQLRPISVDNLSAAKHAQLRTIWASDVPASRICNLLAGLALMDWEMEEDST